MLCLYMHTPPCLISYRGTSSLKQPVNPDGNTIKMDADDGNDNGVEQTPDQDEDFPGDETEFPDVEDAPDGSGGDDPVQGDNPGGEPGGGDAVDDEPTTGEPIEAPTYDPDVILDDDGNVVQAGNNTSPLIVDVGGPEAGQTASEGNPAVSYPKLDRRLTKDIVSSCSSFAW
jgi:hypothetical protein